MTQFFLLAESKELSNDEEWCVTMWTQNNVKSPKKKWNTSEDSSDKLSVNALRFQKCIIIAVIEGVAALVWLNDIIRNRALIW